MKIVVSNSVRNFSSVFEFLGCSLGVLETKNCKAMDFSGVLDFCASVSELVSICSELERLLAKLRPPVIVQEPSLSICIDDTVSTHFMMTGTFNERPVFRIVVEKDNITLDFEESLPQAVRPFVRVLLSKLS